MLYGVTAQINRARINPRRTARGRIPRPGPVSCGISAIPSVEVPMGGMVRVFFRFHSFRFHHAAPWGDSSSRAFWASNNNWAYCSCVG